MLLVTAAFGTWQRLEVVDTMLRFRFEGVAQAEIPVAWSHGALGRIHSLKVCVQSIEVPSVTVMVPVACFVFCGLALRSS